MDSRLAWIVFLQGLGPVATALAHVFSAAGSGYLYLLVVAGLVWCMDAGFGIRIGLLVISSAGVNDVLKLAFGLPRPYWVSPEVAGVSGEGTFGLPSGHAQTGAVIWGWLAARARRRWFTVAAVLAVLGISLSRLILGVHFPVDILAGWVVGSSLLALALLLDKPLSQRIRRWSLPAHIASVGAASLLLLGLGAFSLRATAGRPVPDSWRSNAEAARPGDDPIQPRSMLGVVTRAGALLGFGVGAAVLHARGGLRRADSIVEAVQRFAIGAIGVLVLTLGLSAISPSGEDLAASLWRYVAYAAIGGWMGYGAPWMFAALKLA